MNKCALFTENMFLYERFDGKSDYATDSDTRSSFLTKSFIYYNSQLNNNDDGNNFAIKVTGKFKITTAGKYWFRCGGWDRIKLIVDGKVIVEAENSVSDDTLTTSWG